jgi:hypothetical protein
VETAAEASMVGRVVFVVTGVGVLSLKGCPKIDERE